MAVSIQITARLCTTVFAEQRSPSRYMEEPDRSVVKLAKYFDAELEDVGTLQRESRPKYSVPVDTNSTSPVYCVAVWFLCLMYQLKYKPSDSELVLVPPAVIAYPVHLARVSLREQLRILGETSLMQGGAVSGSALKTAIESTRGLLRDA